MASFPQQFLYTVDGFGCPAEIINGARTIANLRASNDPRWQDLRTDCGCPSLLLNPVTTTFTPPVGVSTSIWTPLDTHIQQAPWFVPGVGASSEAYGFMITEWSGLDGAHHVRSSVDAVSGRGGSYFGPLTSKGRVWKLNVQLFAATERGLDYLFHWLENQLMGCCRSDGSGSLWIREFCPTSDGTGNTNNEEGMARADRVALIEGPTWETPPIDEFACVLRSASFSLGIGDPCLYRPQPVDEVVGTGLTATAAASAFAAVATTDGFTGPGSLSTIYTEAPCNLFTTSQVNLTMPRASYGRMAAVVVITSPAEVLSGGGNAVVPDLRVICHYDRAGLGTGSPCANTRSSAMILSGMLAGEQVRIDIGRRQILRRGALNGAEWEDASYLIVPQPPLRPWASFDPVYLGEVTVEPACGSQFLDSATGVIATTGLVSQWTVDITCQEHFGCRC